MNTFPHRCARAHQQSRSSLRLLEAWRCPRRDYHRPAALLAPKSQRTESRRIPESRLTSGDKPQRAPLDKSPSAPVHRHLNPRVAQPTRTRIDERPTENISSQTTSAHQSTRPDLDNVRRAQDLIEPILQSDASPGEPTVLVALRACRLAPATAASTGSPTSALLSLDAPRRPTAQTADALANLAFQLMSHPPVFITSPVLQTYVGILKALRRPQTFPIALALYANKPVPRAGTDPPVYADAKPRAVAAAVPAHVASAALAAAIDAKDLTLALEVIDASYRAPAFARSKLVRKVLPPAVGACALPPVAYGAAARFADLQTNMDPAQLTWMTFAAIGAYVVATGSIGLVAITTANDQMERVTWAPGVPLRERWLREEERAALDRVACAWGFKEVWRRGEEEGVEWEGLREWIGLRGMVLDRVDLMEGMQ